MEYRLEELFDLQMGKTPSRSVTEYWESGNNKWISIADLSKCGKYIYDTKECLSDIAVSESGIKQIPANTVVMSFKLSIGKTAITSEPMYSNEAIMSFRDRKLVQLLPEYIYYLLLSKNWDDGTNKAVMGKTLNKATLSKVKVNIHSMQEQQEIVYVLNQATALIELHQQQLQKLDELVKARFVEMFGGIHDSSLYPYVPVKELTHVISGGTPSRDVLEYWRDGTIPWVKTTELQNKIITEVDEHITSKGLAASSAKIVPPNTTLIAMYGQGKTRGMTGYLGISASTNQACACILPSPEINSVYIWKYFELSYDKLRNMAKGGNQPNLNGNMIKNFPVLVPPIKRQEEYVQFVNQVDKSKVAVQKSLDEAQLLFDSLMQQYFG